MCARRHLTPDQFFVYKQQNEHSSPGRDASTAEAAPGRVRRGEQGNARPANSALRSGPHLKLE